jgi:ABC-type multidrug transport system permease subunit
MGYVTTASYPIATLLTVINSSYPLFLYFFLARIVNRNSAVGGDYFTFVMIGIITSVIVFGTIRSFSVELDETIAQGRMEMLLITPLSWQFLPIGLGLWPAFFNAILGGAAFLVTIALGAHYRVGGILAAAVVLFLGIAAALGIGLLVAGGRVLSKKQDPTFVFYSVAAVLVGGQVFPINVLPAPLRALSWVIPSAYVNSGIRHALMFHARGIYGPGPLGASACLFIFDIVLYPIAWRVLGRAFNYGRRTGVLAGY